MSGAKMLMSCRSIIFVVAIVALAVACLGFPSVAAAQETSDDAGVLLAGAAIVDVTPEIGVPLAGFSGGKRRLIPFDIWNEYPYAHYFAPSEGVRDPIRAKSLLLERGGRRLVFVSVDLVAAASTMRDDLLHRLRDVMGKDDTLILAATHTHSGPGALTDNGFWALYVADRFVPEIYRAFMDGLEKAVREAIQERRPADLVTWQAEIDGVQENRRSGDDFDNVLTMLGARDDKGRWIGLMANFAIHSVAYSANSGNLFSADLAGGIERAIADRFAPADAAGLPVLFLSGAAGDVSPVGRREKNVIRISDKVADAAASSAKQARPLDKDWSVRHANVDLGKPKIPLAICAEKDFWRHFLWDSAAISLDSWLPDQLEITVVRFGDVVLATWPGEPTTALGRMIDSAARDVGFSDAIVLGLANGYLHYFTTADEYAEGGYEACNDFYGADAGETVVGAIRSLMAAN